MWTSLMMLLAASTSQPLSMDGTSMAFSGAHGAAQGVSGTAAPPQPLLLTPLLEAGNATLARELAAVPPMLPACCTGYSGFLTVDKEYDSNLFFWFFPSETRRKTAPLVVWLQGGPGTSMMRPVFLENGPYQIDTRDRRLVRRRASFTRMHSVLYFDNPVGTGYSFTRNPEGLSKNVHEISRSLIEALRQFFIMFPDQRDRDLYIAGESYGGKMATALAHAISRLPNPTSTGDLLPATATGFNLKGLIAVNALIDPESQLDKSEVAFNLGLVDEEGRDEMRSVAQEQIRLIREGRWTDAMKLSKDECGGNVSPTETGMLGLTNLLLWNGTQDDGFDDLAQHQHIRAALHVGNVPFTGRASATVGRALRNDIGQSVLPLLGELADRYRVLIVNGQMDLCIPYRLTAAFVRKMPWQGADQLASARRTTWCVRGQLAGYTRSAAGLTHVLVRNAGHYLAQDQPRWAADMLQKFTDNQSFDTCEERCPDVAVLRRPA